MALLLLLRCIGVVRCCRAATDSTANYKATWVRWPAILNWHLKECRLLRLSTFRHYLFLSSVVTEWCRIFRRREGLLILARVIGVTNWMNRCISLFPLSWCNASVHWGDSELSLCVRAIIACELSSSWGWGWLVPIFFFNSGLRKIYDWIGLLHLVRAKVTALIYGTIWVIFDDPVIARIRCRHYFALRLLGFLLAFKFLDRRGDFLGVSTLTGTACICAVIFVFIQNSCWSLQLEFIGFRWSTCFMVRLLTRFELLSCAWNFLLSNERLQVGVCIHGGVGTATRYLTSTCTSFSSKHLSLY